MTEVEVLAADSSVLEEVKLLWRAHSDTLGFFPAGAFKERADKGQILVALDENRDLAGYLLYYVDRKPRAQITHLCVSPKFRGQGIARQLVDQLRTETAHCIGVGLLCRRDFSVWSLWKELGFRAAGEELGRGGHKTYFWMSHQYPSLFPTTMWSDDRMVVAIDANVFFDLDDGDRREAEESGGLVADWLEPHIRLCVTEELFNEIHNNPDPAQRDERLRTAKQFDQLESTVDAFHVALDEIRDLLGEPSSEQQRADQRQLARAVASNAHFFVTRDQELLSAESGIYGKYGLTVLRPSELVSRFDELCNERDYQRERLAGTAILRGKISRQADSLATAFQLDGEKRADLRQQLDKSFAHPGQFECQTVGQAGGEPTALFVLEHDGSSLRVPLLRLSRKTHKSRTAGSLVRTLLTHIVRYGLTNGITSIVVTDQSAITRFSTAFADQGFIVSNGAALKMSLRKATGISRLPGIVREAVASSGITSTEIDGLISLLSEPGLADDVQQVLRLEHLLWPLKLRDTAVQSFVVPIEPRWATDLFDHGLANNTLFGADTELALNPDSVYYRSVVPQVPRGCGRILWYVSQHGKVAGSKHVRACSQITGVEVGCASKIYKRFRRFGVYSWHDVAGVADSSGSVMAIQFTDTECFENPVPYSTTQSVLQQSGKRNTFTSPVRISDEVFFDMYAAGTGMDSLTTGD